MFCVRCGVSLPSDERFCPTCGAPASLAAPPDGASSDSGVCRECRAPVREGQHFCWSCGVVLDPVGEVGSGQRVAATRRRRVPTWAIAAGMLIIASVALLTAAFALVNARRVVFDADRADQVSVAALIKDRDLPGGGWSLTTTNNSSEDTGFIRTIASNPVCSGVSQKVTKADVEVDFGRAGRAQRAFTRDPSSQTIVPTRVETQVQVYWDSSRISNSLSAQKDLLEDAGFKKCFSEALFGGLAGISSAPSVIVEPVNASTQTPQNGLSDAYHIDFEWALDSTIKINGAFRLEAYYWRYGNAMASVILFGAVDEITPQLATAAVSSTQASLEQVARGKK